MSWSVSLVLESLALLAAVPTSILALLSLYKLFRRRLTRTHTFLHPSIIAFANPPSDIHSQMMLTYASAENYNPEARHAPRLAPVTSGNYMEAWFFRSYQATGWCSILP